MNHLVKEFYEPIKDVFGEPQNWRGINFYPIKLKDGSTQELFYKVLQWPKKFIEDEQIQRLSYLKYLIYVVGHTEKNILEDLSQLLELVTQKNVEFSYEFINGDSSDFLNGLVIYFTIGEERFTEQDFDVIREVILLQNGLSTGWIESYDPELEKMSIDEMNRYDSLTTEEEIFKLCSLMKCPVSTLEDYTLYQFKKHFHQQILLFQYDLYAPLEVSGQISSKNGREIVKPYFTHIDEGGRYSNVLIPLDDFFDSHNDPDMLDETGRRVMDLNNDK